MTTMIGRTALAAGALAALLCFPARADDVPRDFVGSVVRIVDGDTFVVRTDDAEIRVRVWGIDAPESKQVCEKSGTGLFGSWFPSKWDCGAAAKWAMIDLIGSPLGSVRCATKAPDPYGRTVAQCINSLGQDVGGAMVRSGMAVDYRRYSRGAYQDAQAEAKAAGRGIWRGAFEMPAEYRHRTRRGD